MANVVRFTVGVGLNLQPGQTIHWSWMNAWQESVYTASLDVWRAKYVLSGNPRMEVTRIESRSSYEGSAVYPSKYEIHFFLTNTGTVMVNFRLNAAVVSK